MADSNAPPRPRQHAPQAGRPRAGAASAAAAPDARPAPDACAAPRTRRKAVLYTAEDRAALGSAVPAAWAAELLGEASSGSSSAVVDKQSIGTTKTATAVVLGDLTKQDLRKLAEYRNIRLPQRLQTKPALAKALLSHAEVTSFDSSSPLASPKANLAPVALAQKAGAKMDEFVAVSAVENISKVHIAGDTSAVSAVPASAESVPGLGTGGSESQASSSKTRYSAEELALLHSSVPASAFAALDQDRRDSILKKRRRSGEQAVFSNLDKLDLLRIAAHLGVDVKGMTKPAQVQVVLDTHARRSSNERQAAVNGAAESGTPSLKKSAGAGRPANVVKKGKSAAATAAVADPAAVQPEKSGSTTNGGTSHSSFLVEPSASSPKESVRKSRYTAEQISILQRRISEPLLAVLNQERRQSISNRSRKSGEPATFSLLEKSDLMEIAAHLSVEVKSTASKPDLAQIISEAPAFIAIQPSSPHAQLSADPPLADVVHLSVSSCETESTALTAASVAENSRVISDREQEPSGTPPGASRPRSPTPIPQSLPMGAVDPVQNTITASTDVIASASKLPLAPSGDIGVFCAACGQLFEYPQTDGRVNGNNRQAGRQRASRHIAAVHLEDQMRQIRMDATIEAPLRERWEKVYGILTEHQAKQRYVIYIRRGVVVEAVSKTEVPLPAELTLEIFEESAQYSLDIVRGSRKRRVDAPSPASRPDKRPRQERRRDHRLPSDDEGDQRSLHIYSTPARASGLIVRREWNVPIDPVFVDWREFEPLRGLGASAAAGTRADGGSPNQGGESQYDNGDPDDPLHDVMLPSEIGDDGPLPGHVRWMLMIQNLANRDLDLEYYSDESDSASSDGFLDDTEHIRANADEYRRIAEAAELGEAFDPSAPIEPDACIVAHHVTDAEFQTQQRERDELEEHANKLKIPKNVNFEQPQRRALNLGMSDALTTTSAREAHRNKPLHEKTQHANQEVNKPNKKLVPSKDDKIKSGFSSLKRAVKKLPLNVLHGKSFPTDLYSQLSKLCGLIDNVEKSDKDRVWNDATFIQRLKECGLKHFSDHVLTQACKRVVHLKDKSLVQAALEERNRELRVLDSLLAECSNADQINSELNNGASTLASAVSRCIDAHVKHARCLVDRKSLRSKEQIKFHRKSAVLEFCLKLAADQFNIPAAPTAERKNFANMLRAIPAKVKAAKATLKDQRRSTDSESVGKQSLVRHDADAHGSAAAGSAAKSAAASQSSTDNKDIDMVDLQTHSPSE